ncbi:MAG: hypothetical protein H7210_09360 [Pyrinomonadaceae bacterium]|nr:hypothetical protein [Phycisphaerales bacterium]
MAALKGDEDLYQRGRLLVRIIKDESPPTVVRRESGSPVISPLLAPTLRETLTRSARFCRPKGDELVECHPTQWLVNAIHCRGSWPGVRHLSGYSDAPVLRADGSVWQEPGYDHQTCILYQPNAKFEPVPMNPTRDDAARSAVALLEVVQDFRFEGECHRAGYVAGLLSPLARACYAGSTPLFLIDANKPGSGKGLLAKTIGQIVSGRELPVSSYCHDAEEMRKQITTIAMAGDPMVLLDNLHGNFGNGPLDRALTTNWWRDRVLSTNLQVELPLLMTWYATGNNVQIVGDTIRRIIHIRLVVLNEHPEHRSDFKHPDLLGWVSISRPNLVRAALTVLSAYIRAGMPRQNLRPMGGFEGWSRLVREAVVWAGLEDPALSTDSLAATSDVETESLEMLVRAWRMYDPHGDGLVVSDLLHSLYDGYTGDLISDDPRGAMRAAIQQITGTPTGRTPDPRRVGNRFKSFRQVVTDGAYLDINPMEKRRNGGVWRLYEVAQSSKSL